MHYLHSMYNIIFFVSIIIPLFNQSSVGDVPVNRSITI